MDTFGLAMERNWRLAMEAQQAAYKILKVLLLPSSFSFFHTKIDSTFDRAFRLFFTTPKHFSTRTGTDTSNNQALSTRWDI